MGIVSDKEFDSESSKLKSSKISEREESNSIPIKSEAVIIDVNKGRGTGNVEVPNSLRNVIGETVITDGRTEAVQLARNFGISPSSASAYGHGALSTATYDEKPNSGLINGVKNKIATRARNKLLIALKHITEEKLESAKPRDLAGIAKDMSAVVRSMEDSDNPNNPKGNNGPTFIFYSPQFRKEEVFDVVYAKE